MTDPDPIETWLVELEGSLVDLTNWQQLFYDRAIASVEPSVGRDSEQAYFVHSQYLDGVPDTEAHITSGRLIAQMNGAAKLCDGRPVKVKWLWFIRAGGKPEPLKQVSVIGSLPTEWLAGVGDGKPTGRKLEPRALKAMAAACNDSQVAKAIEHFGQPNNWYDLWIAYEIIEDDLWNSTPRQARPKPTKKLRAKRVLLMSRKWALNNDFRKFAESCNYHRHGRKNPPTAEQSATLDEARQILARIIQSWIDEKFP